MRTYIITIVNEQGRYGVKQGIIKAVYNIIPIPCLAQQGNLVENGMSFLYLQANHSPALLIIKTHTNTIFSCSTFL